MTGDFGFVTIGHSKIRPHTIGNLALDGYARRHVDDDDATIRPISARC